MGMRLAFATWYAAPEAPGKAEETLRMKEPYEKGIANHLDPESWVIVQQGGGQALTGARAGRAIESRKALVWGADAMGAGGRPHRVHRHTRGVPGLHAVLEPEHVRKRHFGTWEISRFTTARVSWCVKGSPRTQA